MVSDAEIREVCARVAAETNPDEQEQLLVGLRMLAEQYVRERTTSLAYSNSAHEGSNGSKHAA
jgi:hypothetical protein